jgi:glutamyl-tRNA synthetase
MNPPMARVRTRFAPSPTGYLHLGGARTALFNYLFARHHGGRFVLRIEDTDRARSSQEFVDAILDALGWLGLEADEGPIFQSGRDDLYRGKVEQLLQGGHAYYCFCSSEELEAKRKQAHKHGRNPSYDRTCRNLDRRPRSGERAVVRFRCATEGQTGFSDLVRGPVVFENAELDDLIIVRSDGTPTFHLVVVVDDIELGITHILRGEDHVSNTPRQIGICRALGAEPPQYAHLPLIVGQDRARLSKRHGATSVGAYREQGFVAEAVVNYLARLGWSHGDQEIFSLDELVEMFDIGGVGKAASAFDTEKFSWVNFEHMRTMDEDRLAGAVEPFVAAVAGEAFDQERLRRAVPLLRDRAHTLVELAQQSRCLVADDLRYEPKAVSKFLGETERDRLRVLAEVLAEVDPWEVAEIDRAFATVLERFELKLGKLAQPARVALTGGTVSPGIFELCEVLGKDRTVARLHSACDGAESATLPLTEA